VSQSPGSLRGHTVHAVRLTPFRFDLNGRVVDVKPMFDILHPTARSTCCPSRSLEDVLFVRRFRRLRQRMMAAAQAEGIYTDEDVFTRVS
jgi:hypothetical protein